MTWKEIENVHATLAKFPQREAFLKSLYPDAFFETIITESVSFAWDFPFSHSSYGDLWISYGGKKVAKIKLKAESTLCGVNNKLKWTREYAIDVKPGFCVETLRDGGTRIIKYGPQNAPGGGKK